MKAWIQLINRTAPPAFIPIFAPLYETRQSVRNYIRLYMHNVELMERILGELDHAEARLEDSFRLFREQGNEPDTHTLPRRRRGHGYREG